MPLIYIKFMGDVWTLSVYLSFLLFEYDGKTQMSILWCKIYIHKYWIVKIQSKRLLQYYHNQLSIYHHTTRSWSHCWNDLSSAMALATLVVASRGSAWKRRLQLKNRSHNMEGKEKKNLKRLLQSMWCWMPKKIKIFTNP